MLPNTAAGFGVALCANAGRNGRIQHLSFELENNDSEIETTACECIAEDFSVIAAAYGFDADMEELIATRDW